MAGKTGEATLTNYPVVWEFDSRLSDPLYSSINVAVNGRYVSVGNQTFTDIDELRIIANDQPTYTSYIDHYRPLIITGGQLILSWREPTSVWHSEHFVTLPNFDGSTLTGTITFEGGYGGDRLDGSGVSNVIVARGGPDNDRLTAGRNDDSIQGDAGDDVIAGNGGYDTAIWASARAEYSIRTYAEAGVLKTAVVHEGGSHADGTDVLTGIEALSFAGHVFGALGGQLNRTSNVDGDRFDDVLFQNASTGQVYFAKMVDGAFQSWGVDTAPLSADWKAIGSGDVNPGLTGGAEVFVQQQSTGAIYYASLDTGVTVWGAVDAPGTDWKLRAVADMNGDTAADAVVQSTTTGAIKYAAMFNGSFAGYDWVSQNLTSDWLVVGAGDINRDGLADVVIQQQSTGTAYYAVMAGGAFQYWDVISQNLTPDWRVGAVADLTGDGFADVVVQSQSTGTAYYADMAGGNFAGWGVVAQNTGPTWKVEGVADVDNDGFSDVLFQNQTNGTTYSASMGSTGFKGWGVVATHIGPDWHAI